MKEADFREVLASVHGEVAGMWWWLRMCMNTVSTLQTIGNSWIGSSEAEGIG